MQWGVMVQVITTVAICAKDRVMAGTVTPRPECVSIVKQENMVTSATLIVPRIVKIIVVRRMAEIVLNVSQEHIAINVTRPVQLLVMRRYVKRTQGPATDAFHKRTEIAANIIVLRIARIVCAYKTLDIATTAVLASMVISVNSTVPTIARIPSV